VQDLHRQNGDVADIKIAWHDHKRRF
jgi:hypothetical protein